MTALRPPTGVGATALGVARVRMGETRRPDRLFDDPLAEAFLAAAPDALPDRATPSEGGKDIGAAFTFHVVIRTRFYDDHLLSACAAGCRQVVLLAAGLDTRAFRLAWPPGVRLFELDLPDVVSFKEKVLTERGAQPTCERVVLPVDLRDDWSARLSEAGFRADEPAAWLAEGLLAYLDADEAARLLTAVGDASAPGSVIAFERGTVAASGVNADVDAAARATPTMDRYTSLWKGGLGPDPVEWLTEHGWAPSTHDLTDVAASVGRPVRTRSRSGFLTAERLGVTRGDSRR
jgi:methyltransferase (TIGR00027 family)